MEALILFLWLLAGAAVLLTVGVWLVRPEVFASECPADEVGGGR